MDKIIPVSELRSHLSEVTKWVEAYHLPVFLTKNGRGRFVLLDMESYSDLLAKADGTAGADTADTSAGADTEQKSAPLQIEEIPPVPSSQHQSLSDKTAQENTAQNSVSSASNAAEAPSTENLPDTSSVKRQELPDAQDHPLSKEERIKAELKEEEDRIFRELGLL